MREEFSTEHLSDLQRQQLLHFDREEKKWINGIEEQKRDLETELKKKELSVADEIDTFDSKLDSLRKEREVICRALSFGELYVYTMGKTIAETESVDKTITGHLQERVELVSSHETLSRNMEDGKKQIDHLRNSLHQQLHKDKAMDKSFKKNMQKASQDPLDQETVNLLYQFFKDRRSHVGDRKRGKVTRNAQPKHSTISQRSKLGRQSGRESLSSISIKQRHSSDVGPESQSSSSSFEEKNKTLVGNIEMALEELEGTLNVDAFLSNNDPFVENNGLFHDRPKILHPEIDEIPEGFVISDHLWQNMLKAREEKITQEDIISKTTATLKDMKAVYEYERGTKSDVLNKLNDLDASLVVLKKENCKEMVCPEFVLNMKQGQKEITSLSSSSAILIKSWIVENANGKIRGLGDEHSRVLNKINVFGKKIDSLKWKQELLDLKLTHGKELYIDYQLLRLTTELKTMLSGDMKCKKMHSETKDQIARLQETHQKKLNRFLMEKKKLQNLFNEREDDNKNLARQLITLTDIVHLKEEKSKVRIIVLRYSQTPFISR